MKGGPRYKVKFRRRRLGITDYRKRLKLLLSGKPRLVVRKSLNNVIAQIVLYNEEGDKVIAHADVFELRKKFGWRMHANVPAAYLVGLLIGRKALEKGISEAVLDIGRQKATKGNKLFAVLRGAVEAGLKIPHSEEVLPSDERIYGEHLAKFAELNEQYLKSLKARGLEPGKIRKHIEEVKAKIMGGGA